MKNYIRIMIFENNMFYFGHTLILPVALLPYLSYNSQEMPWKDYLFQIMFAITCIVLVVGGGHGHIY